jgi:site-specific DNA-methyltransferase (adenine-specific)
MIKIINYDCVTGMDFLAPNQIDLCITSPPYKDADGYSEDLMYDSFSEVYRLLKDDSLCFVNFGHLAEDKARPFKLLGILLDIGFELNDTITWVKNHYRPIQGNKRLNNLSEFIFLLYKGKMPKIDRLSIGIPYKDKSNAKRFAGGRDLKCRGNVWYIDYETIQSKEDKLHNDRFPLELPETCIRLSGLNKGTVLDPFVGSGTTALAAKNFKLNCIGFEKNPDMYKVAIERTKDLPF